MRTASVGGGEAVSHTAHDAAFTVTVTANSSTAIHTVGADRTPYSSRLTLDGRRLQSAPAQRGVYVIGDKKVVVK